MNKARTNGSIYMTKKIVNLLKQKESKNRLNRDVYDTVYAFANSEGEYIAKVFSERGYAQELESGMRNMFKYSKIYGGSDPKLEEENIFKATILLEATDQAILNFSQEAKSTNEIMQLLNLKHKRHFRTTILKPLLEKGLLNETIPDKPKQAPSRSILK